MTINTRKLVGLLSVVAGGIFAANAQNTAPTVHAGTDISISTNEDFFLDGTADDAEQPDALTLTWTRISGPATATILDPSSSYTLVTFAEAGVYQFELKASDGQLSTTDTIKVTVRAPLPFLVLNPADGANVKIGQPIMIRWQMDPSKPCRVEASYDDTSMIISNQAISDSMLWQVPSTIQPGSSGVIRILEYGSTSNSTQAQVVFVSEQTPSAPKEDGKCGAGVGLAFLPLIGYRVARRRFRLRS